MSYPTSPEGQNPSFKYLPPPPANAAEYQRMQYPLPQPPAQGAIVGQQNHFQQLPPPPAVQEQPGFPVVPYQPNQQMWQNTESTPNTSSSSSSTVVGRVALGLSAGLTLGITSGIQFTHFVDNSLKVHSGSDAAEFVGRPSFLLPLTFWVVAGALFGLRKPRIKFEEPDDVQDNINGFTQAESARTFFRDIREIIE